LFKRFKISPVQDSELIAKYKETGNNSYVGELFKRYSHLVFGVCMKYLKDSDNSKDAVMQIFEKLLTDLNKHTIDNFKSWLYSVAKNHCLMQLRNQQIQVSFQDTIKNNNVVMEMEYNLHHTHENNKELDLNNLEKAIGELNSNQKICIELFYLKEKCYQEVSEITGYSMNEVKSHIQNGKRNLKIILSQQDEKH
jgi:RNA polymerase sigma-70 factor (ECF subfamily)